MHTSSYKASVILVRFERNLHFVGKFSKNTYISNFTKIRPVEAELFHADDRTDKRAGGQDRHDRANSRFPQFREFYILLTDSSDVFCIYLRKNNNHSRIHL